MKLKHRTPCNECPWRKEAPAGYMGGPDPAYYADAVAAGEVPACHQHDYGPEDGRTAFCAGALACMSNQAMLPKGEHAGQETAPEARRKVPVNPDVFFHHADFYLHHTGEKWRHPITRIAE